MKLPTKYIAALVMIALIAVFAYQAYWLVGLYHSMNRQMENNIMEALRSADYEEMRLRFKQYRDDKDIQGYTAIGTGLDGQVLKTTVAQADTTIAQPISKKKQTTTITTSYTYTSNDTLSVRSAHDAEVRDSKPGETYQNVVSRLSVYYQRAFHLTTDGISEPDYKCLDSLLTIYLLQFGIDRPHRLIIMQMQDSLHVDTLRMVTQGDFMPNKSNSHFDYHFDPTTNRFERVELPQLGGVLLRQMAGILVTSLVILLVLCFAFWYLIHTLLRMRTLEEMKSDFTNNITHELKTPIAVAYAANDAMLNFGKDGDIEKRKHYLTIVQEQLSRLSGMVEQILSLSMERRRTFQLHKEQVAVTTLLQPIIEQQKMKADKPVNINVDIQPEDLNLNADRTHLGNILGNLIDNAIKYSVGEADVSICITEHSIGISDKGIGIAADKLPYIFDKFYRVPTGNVHDVKGYGIGLFYVKMMVEKHGWTISVESKTDEGTTFTIHL